MSDKEEELEKIRFYATLPPTQSAIQRHGAGSGMRIQLDIPESEMPNALKLITWTQTNMLIEITKVPADQTYLPLVDEAQW